MSGERFKAGLRIFGMGVLLLAQVSCAPKQTIPPNPNDENGDGGNNLSLPGTDMPQSALGDPEPVEAASLAPEEQTQTVTIEPTQPTANPNNLTKVSDEKEWVEVVPEIIWWQDVFDDIDLNPGSEMVKMLDALNLRPSFTFNDSFPDKPGLEGKTASIGKVIYVNRFEDVPFDYGEVSGNQSRIHGIAKKPDGTYSEISYLVAVDFRGAINGFGRVAGGTRYEELFRNDDGTHKSITYDDMVEYYKLLVGKKVAIIIPVWDSRVPFDSKLFAWSVFPNFGKQFNVKPGEAYYSFDNGLYQFGEYACALPDFECNRTQGDNPTNSYGDPQLLLEMAKKSPWGLFVSDISEIE